LLFGVFAMGDEADEVADLKELFGQEQNPDEARVVGPASADAPSADATAAIQAAVQGQLASEQALAATVGDADALFAVFQAFSLFGHKGDTGEVGKTRDGLEAWKPTAAGQDGVRPGETRDHILPTPPNMTLI
jgi:hypothetical protein